ncbi:MAG: hypothetical protein H6878_08730 [Rhodobiaceae bacterium]|nr:hypothetical protein [Rhodobiaceae bacterium]MCC0041343.1 hypothetical protein [Rhodobiaceae bacterium]
MSEEAEIREHVEAALKLVEQDADRLGMIGFHLSCILVELEDLTSLAAPGQVEIS